MNRQNWVIYYVFVVCPATKILTLNSVQAIQINDIYVWALWISKQPTTLNHYAYSSYIKQRLRFANSPGGPLEWQEGVSGSSMDTQKAP